MQALYIVLYSLTVLHLAPLIKRAYEILYYKSSITGKTPPFSIIICARNEFENLKNLIPALFAQEYPNFEIVVALDRCKDNSYQLLLDFQKKYPKLRIVNIETVPEGYTGKKYGLTQAIKAAHNDWLLLTDADCIPGTGTWIQTFADQTHQNTDIIMGISPYTKEKGILNDFIQYETITTASAYISAAIRGKPYMAVGRNLAYRKSFFDKKQGFGDFKNILGGDDDLFIQQHANKLNTRIVLGPESLTYSLPKRSFSSYMTQKTRHFHASKFYKKKIKFLQSYSSMVHLLLWVSFLYLALIYPWHWGVILTFVLLMVIKSILYRLMTRKVGFYYNPVLLPFIDLIFGVIYPFVGIKGHLSRKIKWN